ncbi:MAG: amino acid permease, partial [Candidatus Eisenbacteria bacterium]|nr:amino acid permease [Candidatus Eisenbacteria bacterium]
CGALCFAELVAMFPKTGGAFIFLREGYGRFPAFCYGWSYMLVTTPASIAAVAVVFVAYLARVVPITDAQRPWIAAGVCLLVTVINVIGVRLGTWSLKILTGAKILALAALMIGALLFGKEAETGTALLNGSDLGVMAALAASLVAVIWTYEGWSEGPTLAGEMKRKKDVVIALIVGTLGVTLLYVVLNFAYLKVLGVEKVVASDSVAVDMAQSVFGIRGGNFVTGLVLVSTLGSINGMVIGASRIFFAIARDGLFFERFGRVSKWGTPSWALALVALVSAVYCLNSSFESIIRYFVFVSTFWFVLNIFSVAIHRRRSPKAERPFKVPLYPIPMLVYLVVAIGLLVQLFRDNPKDSLLGHMVLVIALPTYWLWNRATNRGSSA